MESLTVSDLDARTLEGLRILANSHHRTLKAEARAILVQAVRGLGEADELLASMVGGDEPEGRGQHRTRLE
ncbi:MAG: FitA-like ribbon-helix-helix domain-containing protein [Actinomycetota bacterium]